MSHKNILLPKDLSKATKDYYQPQTLKFKLSRLEEASSKLGRLSLFRLQSALYDNTFHKPFAGWHLRAKIRTLSLAAPPKEQAPVSDRMLETTKRTRNLIEELFPNVANRPRVVTSRIAPYLVEAQISCADYRKFMTNTALVLHPDKWDTFDIPEEKQASIQETWLELQAIRNELDDNVERISTILRKIGFESSNIQEDAALLLEFNNVEETTSSFQKLLHNTRRSLEIFGLFITFLLNKVGLCRAPQV